MRRGIRWLGGLAALVALGALPGPAGAEAPVIEARVKVLPTKETAVYLRFQNNKLWMASTEEGLARAAEIRAGSVTRQRDGGMETRAYDFPETDLPLQVKGIEKARATFYYSREIRKGGRAPTDQIRAVGVFAFSRHQGEGAAWTYTMNSIVERPTEQAATQPLEMLVPQVGPEELKLTIETKVEGRNARIGLKVWSGGVDLASVKKGSKHAPATLEIVDLNGKTVVSEKGDLEKFGFT